MNYPAKLKKRHTLNLLDTITIHAIAKMILLIFSCSLLCCNRYGHIQCNMTGEAALRAKVKKTWTRGLLYQEYWSKLELNTYVSPLINAAACGDPNAVMYFLNNMRQPQPIDWQNRAINFQDKEGCTALHHAARRDDRSGWYFTANEDNDNALKIATLLLQKGAYLEIQNDEQFTPLLWAACNDSLPMVQLLLQNGARVDVADKDKMTPLLWATYHKNLEMMQLFLDKGANVAVADKDGNTPCLLAVLRDSQEALKVLVEKGANVEVANKDGNTPLLWAAYYNRPAMVQLLVDKSARVDVVDKDENTPLLWAARNNNLSMVQLLVDKGARVEVADKDGMTAVSLTKDPTIKAYIENALEAKRQAKAWGQWPLEAHS